MSLRVLVVARSPVIAAGLTALAAEGGLTVVRSASGVAGLADAVADTRPDVVLWALDAGDHLRLPPLAPDAAQRPPRLVVVAHDADPRLVPRLVQAGAVAVLPPDATAHAIALAVEAAGAGYGLLDAAALEQLAAQPAAAGAVGMAPPLRAAAPTLTPRELEVQGLMAQGLANRAIAARLSISAHTAKTHVAAVLAKLGVASRAEAVMAGVRQGMVLL